MNYFDKAFKLIEEELKDYGFENVSADAITMMVQDAAVFDVVLTGSLNQFGKNLLKELRKELWLAYLAGGLTVGLVSFCIIKVSNKAKTE